MGLSLLCHWQVVLGAVHKLVQEAFSSNAEKVPSQRASELFVAAYPREQNATETELNSMAQRAADLQGNITQEQIPLILARTQVNSLYPRENI